MNRFEQRAGRRLRTPKIAEGRQEMSRELSVGRIITERLNDQESLVARGSVDQDRLTRDHIFTLCTMTGNPLRITWDEVNAWFEANRPEILTGRG